MGVLVCGRDRFTIGRCLVGGLAAGLGVAAMHYVGISAMRMPAVFLWNLPLVVLSVLIAVIAASAALWLAFNTQNELQRAGAAVLMAVAVCGMHYTGAAAGTVVCTTPRDGAGMQIGGVLLPILPSGCRPWCWCSCAGICNGPPAVFARAWRSASTPSSNRLPPWSRAGPTVPRWDRVRQVPGAGRRQRACGRFLVLASMLRARGRLN